MGLLKSLRGKKEIAKDLDDLPMSLSLGGLTPSEKRNFAEHIGIPEFEAETLGLKEKKKDRTEVVEQTGIQYSLSNFYSTITGLFRKKEKAPEKTEVDSFGETQRAYLEERLNVYFFGSERHVELTERTASSFERRKISTLDDAVQAVGCYLRSTQKSVEKARKLPEDFEKTQYDRDRFIYETAILMMHSKDRGAAKLEVETNYSSQREKLKKLVEDIPIDPLAGDFGLSRVSNQDKRKKLASIIQVHEAEFERLSLYLKQVCYVHDALRVEDDRFAEFRSSLKTLELTASLQSRSVALSIDRMNKEEEYKKEVKEHKSTSRILAAGLALVSGMFLLNSWLTKPYIETPHDYASTQSPEQTPKPFETAKVENGKTPLVVTIEQPYSSTASAPPLDEITSEPETLTASAAENQILQERERVYSLQIKQDGTLWELVESLGVKKARIAEAITDLVSIQNSYPSRAHELKYGETHEQRISRLRTDSMSVVDGIVLYRPDRIPSDYVLEGENFPAHQGWFKKYDASTQGLESLTNDEESSTSSKTKSSNESSKPTRIFSSLGNMLDTAANYVKSKFTKTSTSNYEALQKEFVKKFRAEFRKELASSTGLNSLELDLRGKNPLEPYGLGHKWENFYEANKALVDDLRTAKAS